jgi:carbamoyltransferase
LTHVLGICDGHSSTACLLSDGKIVACASEERFTRVKNQFGFPSQAIRYVLSSGGIEGQQLDLVVLSWRNPFQMLLYAPSIASQSPGFGLNLALKFQPWYLKMAGRFHSLTVFYEWARQTYERLTYASYNRKRIETVAEVIGVDTGKVVLADHGTCHMYASYYANPDRKSEMLIFTSEGEGDSSCAIVTVARNGEFETVALTPRWKSLGDLYGAVTVHLGMKVLEHEYKVMGLAPYAPLEGVKKTYEAMKDLIVLKDDLTFDSPFSSVVFYPHLRRRLEGHRFDYIAGAVQLLTEELIIRWIKSAIKKTGISDIAVGGGVFQNVKVNMLVNELPDVTSVYFCPSPGDESTAIGAAYFGYRLLGKKDCQPLKELYLGPEFGEEAIKTVLKNDSLRSKLSFEKVNDIENVISELLISDKIVARFSGRMEWGTRALGNRSILANPSKQNLKRVLNEAIKMRDFWMPFAPTILDSRASDYIINPKNTAAPYMILAFRSTELAQKELIAAMHPYDFTLRPQVLQESWNPSYYRIIKEFEGRTGIGAILNTSFNLHGEPIVCSPEDAIHTLTSSGLGYLALGPYLVYKK